MSQSFVRNAPEEGGLDNIRRVKTPEFDPNEPIKDKSVKG